MTTSTLSAPVMTNADLQILIDRAALAGAREVILPAGVYLMHDSLKLRSGLRIIGEDGVTLRKVASVRSPINDFLGYGLYDFRVQDPDLFRVGMGVCLLDDAAKGFYTTVARIVARDGDVFFVDRPFNHDYVPSRNGMAVSAFPVVEGCHVEEAGIENIAIDGNNQHESFGLTGCRGGGVFLIGCREVMIRGVEIHHYRGDGISFQQCTDITVEQCEVHGNSGHGLHPGSGSVRYVMRENRVHHNGRDGLFYCLRTTHSTCEHNEFVENSNVGICIGERDTDHLIRENLVRENRSGGIVFRKALVRGGDRVTILGNRLEYNGPGPQITLLTALEDIQIEGNIIQGASADAVAVEAQCSRLRITGNVWNGKPWGAAEISGRVVNEQSAVMPPDARHLGKLK
jgi:hypothetical protein